MLHIDKDAARTEQLENLSVDFPFASVRLMMDRIARDNRVIGAVLRNIARPGLKAVVHVGEPNRFALLYEAASHSVAHWRGEIHEYSFGLRVAFQNRR